MSAQPEDEFAVPNEAICRAEAALFFDALRESDYEAAAEAKSRLESLGWSLARTTAEPPKRRRRYVPRAIG